MYDLKPPAPLPGQPRSDELDMWDMLMSLDSLGEPETPKPAARSQADTAVNAWLASLPDLSFMLEDKLAVPVA